MLCILAVFAVLASAQGRAVNISNTWVLPEEGFPVFYRYFRDRISWYEADAVCQFHHANLVTVDTTAQYDAVRAYLKELDISSAVWVGLIRSNPDGDFTWTDYRGLSGDGYWSSAPDTSSEPLCAAANPSADYRWEARACGGPTVASFICELPVPQWALGNEGCMVRALPALTILYLPESAAVQLTADCGLAGVKRVQCTGNVKREELLKNLACVEEEETTTALNFNSSETNPATSDSTVTDQETTTELTTEGIITTEHEVDVNQPIIIPTTHQEPYLIKYKPNLSNNVLMHKKIDLGDNNAQSNHIPKIADVENVLTNDQLEKLEDERHMQHKMLHEEIARVGNVDNIFTQPTDHFIPPLVMAKAKISDDMTVLSLAEKHAQQLAERHFSKQNFENHSYLDEHSVTSETNADKTLITPIKSDKIKQLKKESYKNNPPKKYVNDKYYDAKNKVSKANDLKVIEKTTEVITSTESVTTKEYSTSTNSPPQIDLKENTKTDNDDENMELTVILKETSINGEQKTTFTNYSGDVAKLDTIINATSTNPIPDTNQNSDNKETDKIMDHDVIKITIIADDDPSLNVTVFEVTTKMPIFKDDVINTTFTSTAIPPVTFYEENHSTEAISKQETTTYLPTEITHTKYENTTTPVTDVTTEVTTKLATEHTPIVSTTQESLSTTVIQTSPTASIQAIAEDTNDTINILNATSIVITDLSDNYNHNESVTSISIDKIDFNNTEIHDDIDKNVTSSDAEEFQSPLLSAANEPLHRPPRTRRPQQPNRNKFNPFRILG